MNDINKFIDINKYWIIAVVVSLLGGVGLGYISKKCVNQQDVMCEKDFTEESDLSSCEIYVDISGSVVNPDVYCLGDGSIISDLIKEAGGLSGEECEEWVLRELNRSQKVENGQKVYIPSKGDIECQKESNQSSTDSAKLSNGKISINKATQSELEMLPGIGPSIAGRIISGRPYQSLEDLLDVKGIGTTIFEKLKQLVSL